MRKELSDLSYTVITHFTDRLDNHYSYYEGDSYPRSGFKVSEARINELLGSKNRKNKPLIIEAQKEKEKAYTRTEISQMNTENLQKLADSVGIADAFNTSGRKLKEVLIEHFNL